MAVRKDRTMGFVGQDLKEWYEAPKVVDHYCDQPDYLGHARLHDHDFHEVAKVTDERGWSPVGGERLRTRHPFLTPVNEGTFMALRVGVLLTEPTGPILKGRLVHRSPAASTPRGGGS